MKWNYKYFNIFDKMTIFSLSLKENFNNSWFMDRILGFLNFTIYICRLLKLQREKVLWQEKNKKKTIVFCIFNAQRLVVIFYFLFVSTPFACSNSLRFFSFSIEIWEVWRSSQTIKNNKKENEGRESHKLFGSIVYDHIFSVNKEWKQK